MRINNRSLFEPRANEAYKIINKADSATVYIYDEISWFGVSADQFVKDFNDIKASTIHLRVNSPGGSVFDGTAIFNTVQQHKSKVIAHVDGLAASIASVIIMAADEVHMSENAFIMIHEPWSIVVGNSDDMRQEANLLDKVGKPIVKTYMDKSGKDEKEIKKMMAAETWLTAEESLEMGFCDHIDKKAEKAQSGLFDLSAFANVPDTLKEQKTAPTIRDIEHILRDAGCTKKQAKSILSDGWKEDCRDDDLLTPDPTLSDQRDADTPKGVDRATALLVRAEIVAPSHT